MENNAFNQQLRERTFDLSVKIQKLLQSKKITLFNRSMVQQVLRSSSSMAANFHSAARARSDAEFYSKICIVVEETDETQFWIKYLLRTEVINDAEANEIIGETTQLVKIFSAIKKTMKMKLNR